GLLVELVEAHGLARHRGVHLDGHGDEPERDGATPDRPSHTPTLPAASAISCHTHAALQACAHRAVCARPTQTVCGGLGGSIGTSRCGSGPGTLGGSGDGVGTGSGSAGTLGVSGTTGVAG